MREYAPTNKQPGDLLTNADWNRVAAAANRAGSTILSTGRQIDVQTANIQGRAGPPSQSPTSVSIIGYVNDNNGNWVTGQYLVNRRYYNYGQNPPVWTNDPTSYTLDTAEMGEDPGSQLELGTIVVAYWNPQRGTYLPSHPVSAIGWYILVPADANSPAATDNLESSGTVTVMAMYLLPGATQYTVDTSKTFTATDLRGGHWAICGEAIKCQMTASGLEVCESGAPAHIGTYHSNGTVTVGTAIVSIQTPFLPSGQTIPDGTQVKIEYMTNGAANSVTIQGWIVGGGNCVFGS